MWFSWPATPLTGNVTGNFVYNWTRDNTAVTGISNKRGNRKYKWNINHNKFPITVTFTIGQQLPVVRLANNTLVINPTPNAVATLFTNDM
jgi:hypothetical protein